MAASGSKAFNSAASSLAKSVGNTMDEFLLAVVLALVVWEVVDLLVFNLVALMGSSVAGLCVFSFSLI